MEKGENLSLDGRMRNIYNKFMLAGTVIDKGIRGWDRRNGR